MEIEPFTWRMRFPSIHGNISDMDVEWVQCVNMLKCTMLNFSLEMKEDGLGVTQGTLKLGDAQGRLRERFVTAGQVRWGKQCTRLKWS
jgi:hypothetical protein